MKLKQMLACMEKKNNNERKESVLFNVLKSK